MKATERVRKPGAKTLFAWLCVALLFVSLVVPVAQAPFVGNINVFSMQDGTAYWFLGFAVIAALATFVKYYRLLVIPGAVVIGTTLLYVYHFDRTKAELANSMQGNIFSGLASAASASIQLQWGIALLIIAGVGLIVAGVLRRDAEALPELFATNRMQFIEGGIGIAVLFLGVAVLPSVIPHSAANAVSSASPEPNPFAASGGGTSPHDMPTPSPDLKVEAMRKVVSVGVLEKGFRKANYEEGTYSDKFSVKLQYHNLTNKTIVGFKGVLEFYDQFGERVQGFRVESQENLTAGAVHVGDYLYDYNQFMHEDQKLRDTPLSKLKVLWEPLRVNFADRSSLSSRDQ